MSKKILCTYNLFNICTYGVITKKNHIFQPIISAIFFTANTSHAQQKSLEIKGTGSKLYLEHVVSSKENFYSISRMYNSPPKDIAGYNNLQFENGLSVGQTIRIPLNENNFTQSASGVHMVRRQEPVYHLQ